jgi:hypothetical protein
MPSGRKASDVFFYRPFRSAEPADLLNEIANELPKRVHDRYKRSLLAQPFWTLSSNGFSLQTLPSLDQPSLDGLAPFCFDGDRDRVAHALGRRPPLLDIESADWFKRETTL